MEEQQEPVKRSADWESIKLALGTLGTEEVVNFLAHGGNLAANGGIEAALFGGAIAALAGWNAPPIVRWVRASLPHHEELEPFQLLTHREPGKRSVLDKLLDRHPEEVGIPEVNTEPLRQTARQAEVDQDIAFNLDGEDDMPSPHKNAHMFLFSSILRSGFTPSLDRMFLCRTEEGQDLYCAVKEPYHVALAGNTGGGKSSIMRMLMLQLCHLRVRVLLLNPHYTRYDIENGEDWTPFEPYLVHPPMECRKYEVIEHYLKAAAKDLIPKRLEKRANSQPVGKPYFIVIDELPSIVREIESAPDYMRIILEEGRKVGVFLISAAQDFLVKTISPKAGGGSIRECYRTVYYVGGDPTTGKTLLDMPPSLIPEDELGKGVVMFRGVPSKKASKVLVPYVDNESLYLLLGPSTYKPSTLVETTEQELTHPDAPLAQDDSPRLVSKEAVEDPYHAQEAARSSEAPVATGRFSKALSPDLLRVYNAYELGKSHRDIAKEIGGISHPTVGKIIQRLKDKGAIDARGQKVLAE